MKYFLTICLLSIAAVTSANAQVTQARFPLIQWKYGWQDGFLANTIGSAKNGDSLPLGTSYLDTGYSPDQIKKAYGFGLIPTNGNGRGQTIAIIDAFGSSNLQSDLDIFCDKFNLPKISVPVSYPNGYPDFSDPAYSGWASETTLDVEWAHAMAPGANIVLVVDADGTMTDQAVQYAVNSLNATIVSMSYGNAEYPGETSEDSYFQALGCVFVAAAGDNKDVCYPASSTNVIGVGGTTLLLNQKTGVYTEKAWSTDAFNGTGGGRSSYESTPPFQMRFNLSSMRETPDVSYDSDPYTGVSVYFTDPTIPGSLGSWIIAGGTSAATPQWAGLLACRASLGQSNDTLLPLFYSKQDYSNPKNSWPLKDITNGAGKYAAVKGYDMATGLGTPLAAQIVALTSLRLNPFQTITPFSIIPTMTYGTLPFAITPPTASSGLQVLVKVKSGPASITNNVITLTGLGAVVLTADQSGNGYFQPAAQVTTSFKVTKGAQTIDPFSLIGSKNIKDPAFSITLPTTTSGLPVSVTVKSGPAKIKNNLVTLSKIPGKVVLAANQRGNDFFARAPEVTTTFPVVAK